MKLLIDIGNSRIKSACSDGTDLSSYKAISWNVNHFETAFDEIAIDCIPKEIWVSNVASEHIAEELSHLCSAKYAKPAIFVKTSSKLGDLVCAYPDPAQLGVDRWVALVAAITLTDLPVLVIDCGTATTVDLVSRTRQHVGGAILPGVATMRRALSGNTARLPSLQGAVQTFSCNTRDAISTGTAYAVAGAIDKFTEKAQALTEGKPDLIITGGEAELVQPLLKHNARHYPELVLLGLQAMSKGRSNG